MWGFGFGEDGRGGRGCLLDAAWGRRSWSSFDQFSGRISSNSSWVGQTVCHGRWTHALLE